MFKLKRDIDSKDEKINLLTEKSNEMIGKLKILEEENVYH